MSSLMYPNRQKYGNFTTVLVETSTKYNKLKSNKARVNVRVFLTVDREGFVAFCIVLYVDSVDTLLEIGLAVLRTDWGLRERNSDAVGTETMTGQRRDVRLRFLTARCLLPHTQKYCS